MRTQTKCTFSLVGLFIIELFPIPFSAIYAFYVIRKRPGWVPGVVERLYQDKPLKAGEIIEDPIPTGHDYLSTRSRCTIVLISMFLVDVIVPLIIPTGIYIVRRRPKWFKNTVNRLYADQITHTTDHPVNEELPEIMEMMEKKLLELEQQNLKFAKSMHIK